MMWDDPEVPLQVLELWSQGPENMILLPELINWPVKEEWLAWNEKGPTNLYTALLWQGQIVIPPISPETSKIATSDGTFAYDPSITGNYRFTKK